MANSLGCAPALCRYWAAADVGAGHVLRSQASPRSQRSESTSRDGFPPFDMAQGALVKVEARTAEAGRGRPVPARRDHGSGQSAEEISRVKAEAIKGQRIWTLAGRRPS